MFLKQISVFIENREGRLGEVLGVLKDNGVNILSLSLADTSDYGLLRLVVDNPEKGSDALCKNGFSAKISDVLLVNIPHKVGELQKLLEALSRENVNIEYMYGLTVEGADASVVIKTNDIKKAAKIIEENK